VRDGDQKVIQVERLAQIARRAEFPRLPLAVGLCAEDDDGGGGAGQLSLGDDGRPVHSRQAQVQQDQARWGPEHQGERFLQQPADALVILDDLDMPQGTHIAPRAKAGGGLPKTEPVVALPGECAQSACQATTVADRCSANATEGPFCYI